MPTRPIRPADPPRQVVFYVSPNLNPAWFSPEQRNYAHYFVNLVRWKWLCWAGGDDSQMVNLKRDYITKVIPKTVWPAVLDRLEGKGVVRVDRTYCPGQRSFGYRLNPDFRDTRRVVCENATLNRRIHRVYATERVAPSPVHHALAKYFESLEFDIERLLGLAAAAEPDDSEQDIEEYRGRLREFVQQIANRDFWFVVDRFGRFHTPLTSLPKQMRPCVTCRGLPLAGLDLANSQPLLAGLCARQYYAGEWSKRRLLERTFENHLDPYRYAPRVSGGVRLPGVEEYIRLCEQGEFYESLMRPGEDRDRFKVKLYREVFFGKNGQRSSLQTRFAARHPEVAAMLCDMKRKDHRRSAWILQNYEASLFLGAICKRHLSEDPTFPIFTIHDALLTTPDYLPRITKIVSREFAQLNCTPKPCFT